MSDDENLTTADEEGRCDIVGTSKLDTSDCDNENIEDSAILKEELCGTIDKDDGWIMDADELKGTRLSEITAV